MLSPEGKGIRPCLVGLNSGEEWSPCTVEDDRVKVGPVTLPVLAPNTGSYQGINDSGYQMMTNYRSLETLADIADSYTLSEVLSGEQLPEDLQKVSGHSDMA